MIKKNLIEFRILFLIELGLRKTHQHRGRELEHYILVALIITIASEKFYFPDPSPGGRLQKILEDVEDEKILNLSIQILMKLT